MTTGHLWVVDQSIHAWHATTCKVFNAFDWNEKQTLSTCGGHRHFHHLSGYSHIAARRFCILVLERQGGTYQKEIEQLSPNTVQLVSYSNEIMRKLKAANRAYKKIFEKLIIRDSSFLFPLTEIHPADSKESLKSVDGPVYNFNGGTVFIVDSFNRQYKEELQHVARIVWQSNDPKAHRLFSELKLELKKQTPDKSVLKVIWDKLVVLVPLTESGLNIVEKILAFIAK